MVNSCGPEIFGADPANVKWNVVRGDTAIVRIEFFENDEQTPYDTSGWTYASTTYDSKGDVLDVLEVMPGNGYVEIKANPDITTNWGIGWSGTVAELTFDLEVTFDDIVWTPVIGTINVMADITRGSL
jgi:hypothetical protein